MEANLENSMNQPKSNENLEFCNPLPSEFLIQTTNASAFIIDYTGFYLEKQQVEFFNKKKGSIVYSQILLISASRCGNVQAWSVFDTKSINLVYEISAVQNRNLCLRGFNASEKFQEGCALGFQSSFYFLLGGFEKSIRFLKIFNP
jgi:hypothetical protein